MSDDRQKILGEYTWLSGLNTENLYELLDDTTLDSSSDTGYLDAILSEIVSRREHKSTDIVSAWRELQQLAADAEQENSAVPEQNSILGVAPEIKTQTKAVNSIRRRRNQLRYILVAVLAVVMLFSIAVVAGAFPSVKKAFQQWTDELFSFSEKPDPQRGVDAGYTSLAEALSANGIIGRLAPTEYPDGYLLINVDVFNEESVQKFNALYQNSDNEMIIISICNDSSTDTAFEKDSSDITTYEAHGISHFIMQNNGRIVALWVNGKYECSISAPNNMAIDDIIKMINTIYER